MEVFVPTTESYTCECGGRTCRVPSIHTRHGQTKKHRMWRWKRLCECLLHETTLSQKVVLLKELKVLVRYV